jgi:hypothetical protein
LKHNLDNDRVAAIYIFGTRADLGQAPVHPKLLCEPVMTRPTFAEIFLFASQTFPGRLCCIANADIYFDETLAALDDIALDGLALCLSRWNVGADGSVKLEGHAAGQDAWIFKSPLHVNQATFTMGRIGCDNRLAYELSRCDLKILNPSRTIRANHLHISGKRNYPSVPVPGPYTSIAPETLEQALAR